MEKKTYRGTIEVKNEKTGEFKAIFSRLNVVDRDGDVTQPGAFIDGQKVRIAYWGHRWEDLPVGIGHIYSDDEKAWVDGKFFLDTETGLETYKTVKNLEDLQEWSYGFDILESEDGTVDGQNVRVLKSLNVYEVSPVLLGAGIGTGTVAIKSKNENVDNGTPKESTDIMSNTEEDETIDGKSREISLETFKQLFEMLTYLGD